MPDPWERMWADDAASRLLGMELVAAGEGRATVTMKVRDDMVNGHGMCHGGLISSLADSAFALACNSPGPVTVAAGFAVDFLAPARLGDTLVAIAIERWRRGRSGIYDVTVTAGAPNGRDVTVVAEFRGRSKELRR